MTTPEQPENTMQAATVTQLRNNMDIEHKYIIQDGKIMPIADVLEWGKWMEANRSKSHLTTESQGIFISTVFLGLNHNWSVFGKPTLWETMIFVKTRKSYKRLHDMQWRYQSAEHAEQMHKLISKTVFSGYSVSWIKKRLEELC